MALAATMTAPRGQEQIDAMIEELRALATLNLLTVAGEHEVPEAVAMTATLIRAKHPDATAVLAALAWELPCWRRGEIHGRDFNKVFPTKAGIAEEVKLGSE